MVSVLYICSASLYFQFGETLPESLCLWATRSDACVDHTSYQCRQLRNGPQGSTARTCRGKTCSLALCESGEATTKAGPRGLHSLSGEEYQRDPSTSSATRTQKRLLPFLFSCLHNEPLKKSIPITLQALQTPFTTAPSGPAQSQARRSLAHTWEEATSQVSPDSCLCSLLGGYSLASPPQSSPTPEENTSEGNM